MRFGEFERHKLQGLIIPTDDHVSLCLSSVACVYTRNALIGATFAVDTGRCLVA